MYIDVFVSPNIYISLNNSGKVHILGRDDTKKLRAYLFTLEIISKWSILEASIPEGAINSFTKALAKELAPSNIQVNAISCGIIDTDMNSHLSSDDINEIVTDIPAGRIGTPKDIALTALSLVNGSDYLTGQIITVDGGWI